MMVNLKKLASQLTTAEWEELQAWRHINAAAATWEGMSPHDDLGDRDEWIFNTAVTMASEMPCTPNGVVNRIYVMADEHRRRAMEEYLGNELNRAAAALADADVADLVKELRGARYGYHVSVKRRKLRTGTTVYLHIRCNKNLLPKLSAHGNAHVAVDLCKRYFPGAHMTSGSFSLMGGFDITVALR